MWREKRDRYYAEIFLVLLSLYPNTKALLFSQSLPNTKAFLKIWLCRSDYLCSEILQIARVTQDNEKEITDLRSKGFMSICAVHYQGLLLNRKS